MNRRHAILALVICTASWGSAACKGRRAPAPSNAPNVETVSAAAAASGSAAPSPVVVATAVPIPPPIVAAAYAKLSDEDLAVPEDFQEETRRTIDLKNYKKELDKIEKELSAPED